MSKNDEVDTIVLTETVIDRLYGVCQWDDSPQ